MLDYLGFKNPEKYFEMEKYRAFIGCFTFNNNILNQFRLYGKENGKEVSGASIMVKNSFFSDNLCAPFKNDRSNTNKLSLFRCVYISDNRIVSIAKRKNSSFFSFKENEEYESYIDSILQQVKIEMENLKIEIQYSGLEDEIICGLLINLRYLFKSTEYEEEQECRILRIEKLEESNKNIISVRDGGKRKSYVDYINMGRNTDEICLSLDDNYMSFIDELKNRGLEHIKVTKYVNNHKS